jgi:hypothetical protein
MGSDKWTQAGMLWDFGCECALSSQEVLAVRWWRAALCGCAAMRLFAGSGLGYRNHRIHRGCGGGSVGGGLRDGGTFAVDKIGYQYCAIHNDGLLFGSNPLLVLPQRATFAALPTMDRKIRLASG